MAAFLIPGIFLLLVQTSETADCDEENPAQDILDVEITTCNSTSAFPSLVWTGSEYGISWVDDRDGNKEIYFTRLDGSGKKIDLDVRITFNSCSSLYPLLVWTGNGYGLSWQDDRDGNWEVYFARLMSDGSKIGSDVRVTKDQERSWYPSFVWTGKEYGLSWQDDRDGSWEIYFARLHDSGRKTGGDMRVTYDESWSAYPSLVFTGNGYGLSWQDDRDGNWEIYFSALDDTGKKSGTDIRVSYDERWSEYPSLAWTGNSYGVSWQDYRDSNWEIYFAAMDSSGKKIGKDLQVTNDFSYSTLPCLIWNGNDYGIAWAHAERVYFARLDSAGNKIGKQIQVTKDPSYSSTPCLIWTGSGYGMSWEDYKNRNYEIHFARLE